MPVKIKVKRGSESSVLTTPLEDGELAYAKDSNSLFIQNDSDKEVISGLLLGPLSDRPSPSVGRRFYFATDTNQLFVSDSLHWIPVNGSSSNIKERYYPVSQADYWYYYLVNIGDYIVWKCRPGRTVYVSGKAPIDMTEFIDVKFYFISKSTQSVNIIFNSDYASVGESYANHSSSKSIACNFNINKVTEVSVGDIFPYISSSDVFGISFKPDAEIYLIGYSLTYR